MKNFPETNGKEGTTRYLHLLIEMAHLHLAKTAGYSGNDPDTWANFRGCEEFGVPTPTGIMVRMSDKWARLKHLLNDPNCDMVGESMRDTLMDLASYAVIMVAILQEEEEHARDAETDAAYDEHYQVDKWYGPNDNMAVNDVLAEYSQSTKFDKFLGELSGWPFDGWKSCPRCGLKQPRGIRSCHHCSFDFATLFDFVEKTDPAAEWLYSTTHKESEPVEFHKCPSCEAEWTGQPDKCPCCGLVLLWTKEGEVFEMKQCPTCEAPVGKYLERCANCGTGLKTDA